MNQMKSEMRLIRVGRLLLMWCIIQLFYSLLILIRHPENPWTTWMVRVSGGTFIKIQASMFFSQLTYIYRGSKLDTIKWKINGSNELLRKREEFCFGKKKKERWKSLWNAFTWVRITHLFSLASFPSVFSFSINLVMADFFFSSFFILSLAWILCLCSSTERL